MLRPLDCRGKYHRRSVLEKTIQSSDESRTGKDVWLLQQAKEIEEKVKQVTPLAVSSKW
jgi:hypothetical protein